MTWTQTGVVVAVLTVVALLIARASSQDDPKQLIHRDKPYICGYAVFEVCSTDPENPYDHLWFIVLPSGVVTIRNPPESPSSCIYINSGFGRGVFVYGSFDSVGKELERVRRETCKE